MPGLSQGQQHEQNRNNGIAIEALCFPVGVPPQFGQAQHAETELVYSCNVPGQCLPFGSYKVGHPKNSHTTV
jgi:hypothetical protein